MASHDSPCPDAAPDGGSDSGQRAPPRPLPGDAREVPGGGARLRESAQAPVSYTHLRAHETSAHL
eukprot:6713056-Alexandrium_andersonii.AAC.1